ncbi:retrovirus-related pol polyprotein from transposon tnt 1-94 [Lasius niger]|uniref:Retrovirus-related pol polyprotein from transposon tnt 1-94 n=1 Tax=Lasius niger TaxID=67767 RepID=A0A0J7K4Z1_LASNI|nr:retrovirus-related pol polyprotein from transposon tnt 1-94 [Lasius niger]
MWTGLKPNFSHLRVFGCKAFAHIPKVSRQKWDPKAKELIFVGYCPETKGYRLLNPETYKITRSRDVTFFEEFENPEQKENDEVDDEENETSVVGTVTYLQPPDDETDDEIDSRADNETDHEEDEEVTEEDTSDTSYKIPTRDFDSEYAPEREEDSEEDSSDNERLEPADDTEPRSPAPENAPAMPRRSTRVPKPIKMNDFITYLSLGRSATDPETAEEALERPDRELWAKAIEEEKKSLIENHTWTLTPLPEGKKVLDTKWVFKTKRNASGEVERYKARLVARGCKQTHGIDYIETYSPVIRYTSIRFLCALAVKYDLRMHQMDVVTAYLHGDLDEEIYARPPKELLDPGQQEKVWKLNKAIYGLKQSGRSWNRKLDRTLKELQLNPSKADPCIYFRRQKGKILLGVYVDDIILLANDDQLLRDTKRKLAEKFKMKDLGEVRNLLGLRVTRDKQQGKIWLDQQAYIEEILKRFNMKGCKLVLTSADPNQKLSKEQNSTTNTEAIEIKGSVPYKEAVGCFIHASQGTRPDISYAVNMVSRFSNNPEKAYWVAVKRICRYLKGTSKLKLEFSKEGNSTIHDYGDADWANESIDRRSITGSLFKLQGGPISWQSKKQSTVALSTTEAEYMALSATCQEALWLRTLARELDPEATKSGTVIY